MDHSDLPEVSDEMTEDFREEIFRPLENFSLDRNLIVKGTVSPSYLYPDQFVVRLEKLMDEYVGGWGAMYTTNEILLNRGLELLTMLKEESSARCCGRFAPASESLGVTSSSFDCGSCRQAFHIPKGNAMAWILLQS